MRVLRLLIVAIFSLFAVAVGMVATAVVSLVTASVLFARRKLRPGVQFPKPVRVEPQARRAKPGDFIEVTATEVRAD